MRKFIILILLSLSFSLSGQMIGIIASQTGAAPAVLENIILWSGDLTNPVWVHDGAIAHTADQANDVEGNATMELLTATAADYASIRQSFTAETSTEYEVSFDVIRGTFATAICQVYEDGGTYATLLNWNYYAETSASVTRISNTFTCGATATLVIKIWITGSGNGTIYLGRAQIRQTSSAEGYIKTEGSIEP